MRHDCLNWGRFMIHPVYIRITKLEGAQRVYISAKWICNTIMTKEWSLCWPIPWRHRCTACCGKSILRDISVTFLYISPKPLLQSWTWLYLQKANKTTFSTISCSYGNIVNFSHTSRIHFSANNMSFRPFKPMGLSAHRRTHRHRQSRRPAFLRLHFQPFMYETF